MDNTEEMRGRDSNRRKQILRTVLREVAPLKKEENSNQRDDELTKKLREALISMSKPKKHAPPIDLQGELQKLRSLALSGMVFVEHAAQDRYEDKEELSNGLYEARGIFSVLTERLDTLICRSMYLI